MALESVEAKSCFLRRMFTLNRTAWSRVCVCARARVVSDFCRISTERQ